MYNDLSLEDMLILAIQYHLSGLNIPRELQEELGEQVIQEITATVIE